MSDHIYEIGLAKTTSTAAAPVATIVPAALASGVRMPEIREIAVYNQSGAAAEIGLGIPAAAGSGTITGGTVQALVQLDPAGHTQVATSFGTSQPTAPANFYRRAQLQAVAGAGSIWTWLPGEFLLWQGATIPQVVIWQFSTVAVTYDIYVKVAE